MKPRPHRTAALGLLLVFAALTQLWWYLSTPLGQAPDEYCHADYVNLLVEHGELPCMGQTRMSPAATIIRFSTSTGGALHINPQRPRESTDEATLWALDRADAQASSTGHLSSAAAHPPLAYALPAALISAAPDKFSPMARWHVFRLFSVAAGLAAVYLGWRIGCRMWPRHGALGGFAAGLWMAALPAAASLRSAASNDPLANLTATAMAGIIMTVRRPRLSDALCLGLALSAGVLTKASLVVFLPVAALWIVMAPMSVARRAWALAGAVVVPVLALLVYRAVHAGSGCWHYFDFTLVWVAPAPQGTVFTGEWRRLLADLIFNLPEDFFGRYGLDRLGRPAWSVVVTMVLVVGALAGFATHRLPAAPRINATPLQGHAVRYAFLMLAMCMGVFALAALRHTMLIGQTGLAGRHLMIVQLPVGVLLVAGWTLLAARVTGGMFRPQVLSLVVASLIAVSMAALCWNDLFNVMQASYFGGLRPWLVFLGGGSPVFDWLCANLPAPLKQPTLWKASYVAYAAVAWACIVYPVVALSRTWKGSHRAALLAFAALGAAAVLAALGV